MIADVVFLAVAGSGFCRTVGRAMIFKRFATGLNMPQDWTRTDRASRK